MVRERAVRHESRCRSTSARCPRIDRAELRIKQVMLNLLSTP